MLTLKKQVRMSAEEFERIADEIGSCELLRGEVVHLSPAGPFHSSIVACVTSALRNWARRTSRGRVFAGETGVIVETDPDTIRGADVAYISYERKPKGPQLKGFLSTPPELVVEVIGAGHGWSELIDKTGQYLRMGVDRVWVIDPKSRRVHVFASDAEPIIMDEEGTLTDDHILPGFSLAVRDLFED